MAPSFVAFSVGIPSDQALTKLALLLPLAVILLFAVQQKGLSVATVQSIVQSTICQDCAEHKLSRNSLDLRLVSSMPAHPLLFPQGRTAT